MRAPFKAYVTTNFDPLLSEAAATFGYTSIFRYPLLETREVPSAQKISGCPSSSKSPMAMSLVDD
jgi:hypothetical protein